MSTRLWNHQKQKKGSKNAKYMGTTMDWTITQNQIQQKDNRQVENNRINTNSSSLAHTPWHGIVSYEPWVA